ncbi:MAG: type IV pilin [Thaumarchaeota archaeon]|nr:type IV pilin [Nitrososphaerota archaeon]
MKELGNSSSRGVSEILATVLLIAITLIAGATLASFVFTQFQTTASIPVISIVPGPTPCFPSVPGTVVSPGGLPVTIPQGDCAFIVQNSGVRAGTIAGVGPSPTFAFDQCNGLSSSSCVVPLNGFSVVAIRYSGSTNQYVSGFLIQSTGPNLYFFISIP